MPVLGQLQSEVGISDDHTSTFATSDRGLIGLEISQPSKTPVSVVIPAYNEEAAVKAQVEAIRDVLCAHGITHEIIVVDDGSEDATAEEALQTGARVLQHLMNRGYGAALKTGIDAAKYDAIVMIDADGTYPSDQIPDLITKLQSADMAVGARIGEDVNIPRLRRPAKWMLRKLATHITERPIPDLNSGLRAFRRECVTQFFPILSNRFSFTTTVTMAFLASGYRVVYHPIDYSRRVGRSKITPWHFMDFAVLIIRMSMMFEPLKVFMPLSFSLILLGIFKVIFDILSVFPRHASVDWSLLFQPVLSTSAILLLFVGFQLLLIGMVADGVVRRVAQYNKPPAPSHGVLVRELSANLEIERQEIVPEIKT